MQYDGTEAIGRSHRRKAAAGPQRPESQEHVQRITLWIDPARGISVQQKLFQPNGDFRLAKYSDIKMNQKLPDDAFKIKTTKKTKVVTPNG